MKSPARLLQKKKRTDNGSTHSSWLLRINLPSTHVSPAGRRQSPFHLRVPHPKITQIPEHHTVWGTLGLSGLRLHTSLTCTVLPLLPPPRPCRSPAPWLPLPELRGGLRRPPVKAACLQPTSGARCGGSQSLFPQLWEVRPAGGVWRGAACLPAAAELVGEGGLLTQSETLPCLPRGWSWQTAARERPGPGLTHPPSLFHVTTGQPLHKVDASQRRARGWQQDGGVHHEILHVHGLHLEERQHRRPH